MAKSFIGIKRLWYGEPITSITGTSLTIEDVKTALATAKEVKNIHKDTWGYEESDPTITDYTNQLTGKPYYRDVEQQGIPTVSFTLGTYEYKDKEALQGGKASDDKKTWERPDESVIIEKAIYALSKTDELIVFPRASIVGKGNFVEKNIGLGVTAVPVETGVDGLASEKWFRDVVLTA